MIFIVVWILVFLFFLVFLVFLVLGLAWLGPSQARLGPGLDPDCGIPKNIKEYQRIQRIPRNTKEYYGIPEFLRNTKEYKGILRNTKEY